MSAAMPYRLSSRTLLWLAAALAFIALLPAAAFNRGWRPWSASGQTAFETSTLAGFVNGDAQVYFTRPRNAMPAPGQAGLDAAVAREMDRAARTIDLAFFDFDLPAVARALTRAKARGRVVRMVIDGQNLATPQVADLLGELQRAGIPITFDRRPALMHNKFVVVDGAVVWTGSWNATANDTFLNNNNAVRLASRELAARFSSEFEQLFAGHAKRGLARRSPEPAVMLGEARVVAAFAPDDDITGLVVRTLEQARSSVDVLAFTFTSEPIAAALLAAGARGVAVRGVVESRNARGSGSQLPALKKAGLDMREDGNCGLMHDKVLVVDGRIVITGSFNWTRQAQAANDENVLLIDNRWLAQRYQDEFARIYRQALKPERCGK